MKKLLVLSTICFVAFITSVQTQAQFGVKLGANFSATADYSNAEDGESISLVPGFQGGIFYNHNVSEKFDLMFELNFEKRGTISKKDYSFQAPILDPETGLPLAILGNYDVYQEAKSYHNYINLPILAVFGGEKFKYYIGPSIGLLVSAKAEFERTTNITVADNTVGTIETKPDDIDWRDYDSFKQIFSSVNVPEEDGNYLNDLDYGINLGAMYQVSENLFVDLRLYQGLADITNNHYDSSIYPTLTATGLSFASRDNKDINLSIQIGVGYSF